MKIYHGWNEKIEVIVIHNMEYSLFLAKSEKCTFCKFDFSEANYYNYFLHGAVNEINEIEFMVLNIKDKLKQFSEDVKKIPVYEGHSNQYILELAQFIHYFKELEEEDL